MITLPRLLLISFCIVVLFAAFHNASAQDTTFFLDRQGQKMTSITWTWPKWGSKRVYITHLSGVRGKPISKDSINDIFLDALGKHFIDDYYRLLGVNSQHVKYENFDGRNRILFHQTYGNVPVWQNEIQIYVAGSVLFSIDAEIIQNINCDTLPKITSAQALDIAKRANKGDGIIFSSPELSILPRPGHEKPTFYLTWKISTNSKNDLTYFVNALDGTLVWTNYSVE